MVFSSCGHCGMCSSGEDSDKIDWQIQMGPLYYTMPESRWNATLLIHNCIYYQIYEIRVRISTW